MHFFGEQSKRSMVARVLPVGYLRVKPTAALSSVTLRKGMLPVHCLLSAQSLFAKARRHRGLGRGTGAAGGVLGGPPLQCSGEG